MKVSQVELNKQRYNKEEIEMLQFNKSYFENKKQKSVLTHSQLKCIKKVFL